MADRIFKAVVDILESGEDLALVRIVRDEGSTPRSAGAKMVVSRSGGVSGTIGGGVVDGAAIEHARRAIESGRSTVVTFDLSAEDAAGTDMVCGGRLEVLCDVVSAHDRNRAFFEAVSALRPAGQKHVLCTEFDENGGGMRAVRRFLLTNGDVDRELPVLADVQNTIRDIGKSLTGSALVTISGRRYCLDTVESRESLFIFGAGHVAKEVAALAMNVGFRTVVLDDRQTFANTSRFPAPAEVLVIDAFSNCLQRLPIDEHSYLVIVTRGHQHDKTVLAQALKTPAGYIGMIGSRKKRDAIYRVLKEEGFTEDDLKRVCSPIGVPIDTDTPEEIAVSIVGQLIHERAQRRP